VLAVLSALVLGIWVLYGRRGISAVVLICRVRRNCVMRVALPVLIGIATRITTLRGRRVRGLLRRIGTSTVLVVRRIVLLRRSILIWWRRPILIWRSSLIIPIRIMLGRMLGRRLAVASSVVIVRGHGFRHWSAKE